MTMKPRPPIEFEKDGLGGQNTKLEVNGWTFRGYSDGSALIYAPKSSLALTPYEAEQVINALIMVSER